jgi:uncharacterized protein (TIGR02453 family)
MQLTSAAKRVTLVCMATRFPGFSPKALTFFRELEKNNDRQWFAAHKEVFEAEVRRPMVELTGLICEDFRKLAADYVPERPEKAIFRIYRDTRFSKDKTPYKTHIGSFLQHRRIEKYAGAAFYFEVSHRSVGVGGGMYMPGAEQLQAVRQAMTTKWQELAKICAGRALVKALGPVQGDKMARVPKGFDPQSPAADWLRYRQIYYYLELPAKLALTPDLYKEILSRLKLLVPFNDFMNNAITAALREREDDGEAGRPARPEPMF